MLEGSYLGHHFGESAKFKVLDELCNCGAKIISNTHLLVNSDYVFGVQTKIRVRDKLKDVYIPFNALPFAEQKGWFPVGAIFWVNYRNDGENIIKSMTNEEAISNYEYFAEPIKNWEMKEDIADYYHSDPFEFSSYVIKANRLLKNFCATNKSYYLNLDVWANQGKEMLLNLIEKHI